MLDSKTFFSLIDLVLAPGRSIQSPASCKPYHDGVSGRATHAHGLDHAEIQSPVDNYFEQTRKKQPFVKFGLPSFHQPTGQSSFLWEQPL